MRNSRAVFSRFNQQSFYCQSIAFLSPFQFLSHRCYASQHASSRTSTPSCGSHPKPNSPPPPPPATPVDGVKHVIVVASGKGGVGKSTTSVNLSIGLSQLGMKVGLLDGDIFGPSIPRMMNLLDTPKPSLSARNKIIPFHSYGVKCISIGLLLPKASSPTIWRGPMVISAINQLLRGVEWDVDVLVVDLPPGTGDAHLSLCQQTKLSGAVIVTTPQLVAIEDVKKGVNMFRTLDVPIYGVVENMSYFKCEKCEVKHELFGNRSSVDAMLKELEISTICELPLEPHISQCSDNGKPIVHQFPKSMSALAYFSLAKTVKSKLLGES